MCIVEKAHYPEFIKTTGVDIEEVLSLHQQEMKTEVD